MTDSANLELSIASHAAPSEGGESLEEETGRTLQVRM